MLLCVAYSIKQSLTPQPTFHLGILCKLLPREHVSARGAVLALEDGRATPHTRPPVRLGVARSLLLSLSDLYGHYMDIKHKVLNYITCQSKQEIKT